MTTQTEEKKYERKNRFNGESAMLTAEEAKRHDRIFINELAATLEDKACLLYTSPSPRDGLLSRMPSSA